VRPSAYDRITATTDLLASLDAIAFETTQMLATLDAAAHEVWPEDRREAKRRVTVIRGRNADPAQLAVRGAAGRDAALALWRLVDRTARFEERRLAASPPALANHPRFQA
jgi:hypothetical protein